MPRKDVETESNLPAENGAALPLEAAAIGGLFIAAAQLANQFRMEGIAADMPLLGTNSAIATLVQLSWPNQHAYTYVLTAG